MHEHFPKLTYDTEEIDSDDEFLEGVDAVKEITRELWFAHDLSDEEQAGLWDELGDYLPDLRDALEDDDTRGEGLEAVCEVLRILPYEEDEIRQQLFDLISAYSGQIAALDRESVGYFADFNLKTEALTYLYWEGDEDQSRLGKKSLSHLVDQATQSGIDPEVLLGGWQDSYSEGLPLQFAMHVKANVEAIQELEVTHKNSSKFLHDSAGIVNFSRWPVDILERQYLERDNRHIPYGTALYPWKDPKNAFGEDKQIFANMDAALRAGGYRLRVAEAADKPGIRRIEYKMNSLYGPASFALIGGHGTKDTIEFGGFDERHTLHVDDFDDLKHPISVDRKFFTSDPTLILISCSTGIEDGIAERLSEKLHATTIAPVAPAVIKDIQVDWQPLDDGTRKPSFRAVYSEGGGEKGHDTPAVKTHVYVNGQLES